MVLGGVYTRDILRSQMPQSIGGVCPNRFNLGPKANRDQGSPESRLGRSKRVKRKHCSRSVQPIAFLYKVGHDFNIFLY